MNQEKIGKFISECRKKKKLTQQDLAYKLGVSDRTIGNWENGRNMPDLSLFKPICDELDITINEFLSGERIEKEVYQEKFEENIINTIDYSSKKIKEKNKSIGLILIILGVLITIISIGIFPSDSSWGGFYSVFGGIISLIGICKLTKKLVYKKRLILALGYFMSYIIILFIIDYIGVVYIHQAPRFALEKIWTENMIIYKTPFYNVYRINYDTSSEYYIVDTKKEYTEETVPKTPFNREEKGIDKLIKYKNKYIGNNSNDGNLINQLPLSEYGYTFQIDSKNLGITINYHITDWYINENYYLEKCLVYNTVSFFSLIDNVEYITYNFSGKSYQVTRKQVVENYPYFNEIIENGINKDNFNKYLEEKIDDIEFIDSIFNKMFINNEE